VIILAARPTLSGTLERLRRTVRVRIRKDAEESHEFSKSGRDFPEITIFSKKVRQGRTFRDGGLECFQHLTPRLRR
jgi:hypothetical protein